LDDVNDHQMLEMSKERGLGKFLFCPSSWCPVHGLLAEQEAEKEEAEEWLIPR